MDILCDMPWIKAVVASVKHRPCDMEYDDLLSSAVIGYYKAADQFDPSRRVAFRTYAEHKIRSAIADAIRAWRGGRAKKAYETVQDPCMDEFPHGDVEGKYQQFLRTIDAARVWRIIDTFPLYDQRVMRLRYKEGLPRRRVARILGVHSSLMKVIEDRILEIIREAVA